MDKYLLRRYFLFIVAVFVNAFGIAFITKGMLGTSPVTSINYVLSMFTPVTMGQWTIITNLLFVLLELPLMGKSDIKADLRIYLLQIPITLCFGTFIDISMSVLFWLDPQMYAAKVISVLIGSFILAAGIALEVKANVAMIAGEYFVRVISKRIGKEFGFVKLGFDVSLVLIACILSLIFLSDIEGVREGTVIAAVAVGPIVHFISPAYKCIDRWISAPAESAAPEMATYRHPVITIAREYGSGGHELGEKLAKKLGIPFYDNQLIELAAKESGMTERFVSEKEQSLSPVVVMSLIIQNYETPLEHSLSSSDALFVAQGRIIKELAAKGPCVILGRCADYILRDYPHLLKVFCYADLASEVKRSIMEYGVSPDKAESEVKRINRARVAHYEYYTSSRWGDPHNYNLMINTASIGIDYATDMIAGIYHKMKEK